MSEQEDWTPQTLKELIGLANIDLPLHTLKRVADAHNTAVAAYQIALAHKGEPTQDAHNAEVEKLKAIIQTHAEAYGKACAALAAEKEKYKAREIELIEDWSAVERDLHKQLVKEREKYQFKVNLTQEIVAMRKLVEAAYKEGRSDGFDSVSATDKYNEERWQQSKAKDALAYEKDLRKATEYAAAETAQEAMELRQQLANKQETIRRLQSALDAALERVEQLTDPEER